MKTIKRVVGLILLVFGMLALFNNAAIWTPNNNKLSIQAFLISGVVVLLLFGVLLTTNKLSGKNGGLRKEECNDRKNIRSVP